MASSIGIRSFSRYCRAALLAGFAIMPAISAPVFAADTADTPVPDETIIVTGVHAQTDVGTKTDTPLIETPQSISIVPADRFTDFGALNLGETLRYSAGVRSEAYGLDTRSDDAFVRGTEPTIYQDGMRRLYGGYRTGSKQEVYNLDRVEVLRGPSSMLYGQAPTGGLINTVSKQPQFDTHFDAFASYGTWNRKEVGADITGPILGDTLAGRIDGVFRDTDTQVRGVGERRWSIQPGLTWKPYSRTELTLIGLFQRDRGGWTSQFVPYVLQLRGQDAPNGQLGFRTNLSNRGDHVNLDTENVTVIFSHRFSDHVRFRSSARYEWFKSDQTLTYPDSYSNPTDPFVAANDPYLLQFFSDYAAKGDGRILNRYAFAEVFHSKTLTTDNQLQFDFATGPAVHKLLVGLDYARYSARTLSAYGGSFNGYDEDGNPIPPDAYPIDAYDPVSRPSTLTLSREPDARETQLGFYAQDQIKLWDRLTVLGGFRHDRATSRSTGSPGSVEQAWTGRVALLYDIGRGLVPYVSWSESFQPVVGNDFYGKSYNPTRGRQYEAGIKWQPDAATFITADIYDLHDTGRLVNDPANPLNSIQAGLIRTRGFEIEAQRTVADDLDLIASYAYTRAKDSAVDVGARVTTNQVESSPKQLASVWAMKRVALSDTWKLRGGAGVRYVGPSWSTSFDDAGNFTLKTPGYVAVDALAGVAWNRWHADLNVTNLFNKHYYSSCLGRGDCFIGLLRTVNLRVGYSF